MIDDILHFVDFFGGNACNGYGRRNVVIDRVTANTLGRLVRTGWYETDARPVAMRRPVDSEAEYDIQTYTNAQLSRPSKIEFSLTTEFIELVDDSRLRLVPPRCSRSVPSRQGLSRRPETRFCNRCSREAESGAFEWESMLLAQSFSQERSYLRLSCLTVPAVLIVRFRCQKCWWKHSLHNIEQV